MLPFFDFMVWPGTLGQVLRMRIRHIVLRGIDVFFVVILVWPGRKLGTLLEEGIISMGLSQKVKGVFNHKGWFQWTFNFMLRKII